MSFASDVAPFPMRTGRLQTLQLTSSGFDSVPNEAYVFHAGTKKLDGKILSNGGRVLGVTALGDSLESAITNAYTATEKISWPHKYCRRDIGKKGLTYL